MSTHPEDYAFPVAPGDVPYWQPGMSLRDWFAGQALVSLPSLCAHDTLLGGMSFEDHVARNAYRLADAMLAARALEHGIGTPTGGDAA